MWLSKPVYDALPYYYLALGAFALIARLYVDWWYWPAICLFVGVLGIGAGLFVWLKRLKSRRAD
jgi:hypothetical protein